MGVNKRFCPFYKPIVAYLAIIWYKTLHYWIKNDLKSQNKLHRQLKLRLITVNYIVMDQKNIIC